MNIDIIERDGTVSVTDRRKTVIFERDTVNGVDPMEAARLYAEYIALLDTCPRAKKNAQEATKASEAVSEYSREAVSEYSREAKTSMKPKKITIRILEGEKVV